MRPTPQIPPELEDYRDHHWRREGMRQIETAPEAERFIEQVGFAACLTDCRRPGPSLYVAVCGRRDAVMPRNVQKDEEASLTWVLKDEIIARGRVYYAKLTRGKAMFLAPRMIPYFHAIWGIRKAEEKQRLSKKAQAILRVLRREWEISTADLRQDAGITDRAAFNKAMDELQAAMIVLPSQVFYQPKFTYIWTLGVGRFPEALRQRVEPADGAARNRPRLSGRRRHDDSRRAGARDRSVQAGRGTRQSRAGQGRLRDDARLWHLPVAVNRRAHLTRAATARRRSPLTRSAAPRVDRRSWRDASESSTRPAPRR